MSIMKKITDIACFILLWALILGAGGWAFYRAWTDEDPTLEPVGIDHRTLAH